MKLIIKLSFLAFVSISLISCESSESPLIKSLQRQNVIIGSGFNFKTGMPVVFSPLTGNEVTKCPSLSSANKKTYAKKSIPPEGCGIEIVESENSELIKNVIEASEKKIITGKILRGGKQIDARFLVTVTALYEGSICGTIWHGGVEYYCCNNQCTRA